TTSGSIYFDDAMVNDLPPGERDVAFVFQSYALYPHLSVFENIAFPLRIKKKAEQEVREKVVETARLLGLEPLLDRHPRALSGGQRQRVALGRAIVRRPKVFLLDEPLSNLDALLRVEMRGEIKRLHRDLRATVLYVTHDQAEAMMLSDRIGVMRDGVLQQCGSPQEIYRRPANRFVAEFIGSPPMNFTKGRLLRGTPMRIELDGATIRFPEDAGRETPQGVVNAIPEDAFQDETVIGIRPERIEIAPRPGASDAQGTVRVVEPMGPETWVIFTLGRAEFCGKGPADFALSPGESIPVRFEKEGVHLFDARSGKRIFSFGSG
ncbi:MAG TPA: ABC transporter ATP-binding protein, partial [Nitrospiria bacterium]|nr:ABC transporter ATP-binding protein [Nitrospiria bacterium]